MRKFVGMTNGEYIIDKAHSEGFCVLNYGLESTMKVCGYPCCEKNMLYLAEHGFCDNCHRLKAIRNGKYILREVK